MMTLEQRAATEAFLDECLRNYSDTLDALIDAHATGDTETYERLGVEASIFHQSIEEAEAALKSGVLPFPAL